MDYNPIINLTDSELTRYAKEGLSEEELLYDELRIKRKKEIKEIAGASAEIGKLLGELAHPPDEAFFREKLSKLYQLSDNMKKSVSSLSDTVHCHKEPPAAFKTVEPAYKAADIHISQDKNGIFHIYLPRLMPKTKDVKPGMLAAYSESYGAPLREALDNAFDGKPEKYNGPVAVTFINCYKRTSGNGIQDYDNLIYSCVADVLPGFFRAAGGSYSMHIDYREADRDGTEIIVQPSKLQNI